MTKAPLSSPLRNLATLALMTVLALGVRIDMELTDADSDALVSQSDRNGVTVNFDDLEYDHATFIKIDVRFADAR